MLLLEQQKQNQTLDTFHFVGIGGIGLSGMAEVMHNMGYKVQGSDAQKNYNTERLHNLGIKIFDFHDGEHVALSSYVVISSAIKPDNPEVIAAKKLNIPVIRRAEMLAELMRLKFSVAISGSHGKTTTTSMTACLFEAAGLNPTVINGGIINNRATNAYLSAPAITLSRKLMNRMQTFIKIPATIAVITNIDPEHMEYYKDFETLTNAFRSFITNLPFYGFGVLCITILLF